MKVCVGGTFNIIHKGHRILLLKAFEVGDHVYIGLTSDSLAEDRKGRKIKPFRERKKELESHLESQGLGGKFTVKQLDDPYGPSAYKDYDAIVVSKETEDNANKINEVRKSNGLEPLKVFTIDLIPAQDGLPISTTRVMNGEIDREGCLIKTVKVSVGSENSVKIGAVRNIFSRVFNEVEIQGMAAQSNVPEQPSEKEVINGAINRAKSALTQVSDFGVGIEAGLFYDEITGKQFDVQYCAVVDKGGRITIGHGPGFTYPREILILIKEGKTIGKAMEERFGIKDIGKKQGAIGYLSEGLLDRTRLSEQAVLMAMLPRIKWGLYEE